MGKRTITFHTNGEDSAWTHDWETTSQRMERYESFHTTQLGLMDSHLAKHRYDAVVLVDGDNEYVFESDYGLWHTNATERDLRKVHQLLRLWKTGAFDGDTPWERSRAIRNDWLRPASITYEGVREDEELRQVTFHVDQAGWQDIHGWLSARILLEMGLSFQTTQMDLLRDWRLLRGYDRIEILHGEHSVVLVHCEDGWHSDSTQRIVRVDNDLFHLWSNCEFYPL